VRYDNENKLVGTDKEYIYTTPKVYDKEDDDFEFFITIIPESPYITAANNSDNTTTIIVNKLKVTGIPGVKENLVKITVKDKKNATTV